VQPDTVSSDSCSNHWFATIVCKASADGQYFWANTVVQNRISVNTHSSKNYRNDIEVRNSNEIYSSYFNGTARGDTSIDTILIKHESNGLIDSVFSNQQHFIFKFSANGDLINTIEPFKALSKLTPLFPYMWFDCRMRLMNGDLYTILSCQLSAHDTFYIPSTTAVNAGINYKRFRYNSNDVIQSVVPLFTGGVQSNLSL
jgi:hypothetical protein